MKGFLKNTLMAGVLVCGHAKAQWTTQVSPAKSNLTDVAFYGTQLGYAVGTKGTILFTNDGGKKWDQLKAPVDADITSVTAIDSLVVMITTASLDGGAAVYESKDRGKNWTRTLSDTRTFTATEAPGKNLFSTSSHIYSSSDLGRKWEEGRSLNLTSSYTKIEFTDPANGIISGNISGVLTYSADLIRTTDGGKNWFDLDKFSFPNANAYSASDALNADSVFLFTNFYNRFIPGDSSQLVLLTNFKLRNILGIYAWKFDSKIIRQSLPDRINDCRFFKSRDAFAVGDKGIIYTTSDMGKRWKMDYKGDRPIKAIHMIDQQTGYAVGDGGLILKRTPMASTASQALKLDARVYPNPATEQAYAEFTTEKDLKIAVHITDANGNIRSQIAGKNFRKGLQKITLPVTKLQNGLYHIQLLSDGNIIASKELLIVR